MVHIENPFKIQKIKQLSVKIFKILKGYYDSIISFKTRIKKFFGSKFKVFDDLLKKKTKQIKATIVEKRAKSKVFDYFCFFIVFVIEGFISLFSPYVLGFLYIIDCIIVPFDMAVSLQRMFDNSILGLIWNSRLFLYIRGLEYWPVFYEKYRRRRNRFKYKISRRIVMPLSEIIHFHLIKRLIWWKITLRDKWILHYWYRLRPYIYFWQYKRRIEACFYNKKGQFLYLRSRFRTFLKTEVVNGFRENRGRVLAHFKMILSYNYYHSIYKMVRANYINYANFRSFFVRNFYTRPKEFKRRLKYIIKRFYKLRINSRFVKYLALRRRKARLYKQFNYLWPAAKLTYWTHRHYLRIKYYVPLKESVNIVYEHVKSRFLLFKFNVWRPTKKGDIKRKQNLERKLAKDRDRMKKFMNLNRVDPLTAGTLLTKMGAFVKEGERGLTYEYKKMYACNYLPGDDKWDKRFKDEKRRRFLYYKRLNLDDTIVQKIEAWRMAEDWKFFWFRSRVYFKFTMLALIFMHSYCIIGGREDLSLLTTKILIPLEPLFIWCIFWVFENFELFYSLIFLQFARAALFKRRAFWIGLCYQTFKVCFFSLVWFGVP